MASSRNAAKSLAGLLLIGLLIPSMLPGTTAFDHAAPEPGDSVLIAAGLFSLSVLRRSKR